MNCLDNFTVENNSNDCMFVCCVVPICDEWNALLANLIENRLKKWPRACMRHTAANVNRSINFVLRSFSTIFERKKAHYIWPHVAIKSQWDTSLSMSLRHCAIRFILSFFSYLPNACYFLVFVCSSQFDFFLSLVTRVQQSIWFKVDLKMKTKKSRSSILMEKKLKNQLSKRIFTLIIMCYRNNTKPS